MDTLEKIASKKKLIEKVRHVLYGEKPKGVDPKSATLQVLLAGLGGGAAAAKIGKMIRDMKPGRAQNSLQRWKAADRGSFAGRLTAAGVIALRNSKARKAMKAYNKRKKIVNTGLAAGGVGLAGMLAAAKSSRKK